MTVESKDDVDISKTHRKFKLASSEDHTLNAYCESTVCSLHCVYSSSDRKGFVLLQHLHRQLVIYLNKP